MVPATAAPPVLIKLRLSKVIVSGFAIKVLNVQFSGGTGNNRLLFKRILNILYDMEA